MSTKLIPAVLLFLCFSGCARQLTNEEIVRETKKCEEAGLSTEYRRDLRGNIDKVQCGPKEEK